MSVLDRVPLTVSDGAHYIAAARGLAPVIEAAADEIEHRGELPPALVATLIDGRFFFCLLQPSFLGGAGATAIFTDNPLERRFRDMHTASQQAQGRPVHFQTVGQILLGLDPQIAMFTF